MPRVDASQLIDVLSSPPRKPVVRFCLCDGDIFVALAKEALSSEGGVATFSGPTCLIDAVNAAGTASLFAAAPPGIVTLEEKLTAKQWTEAVKEISRLPLPPDSSLYIFGTAAQRKIVEEEAVSKFGEYYLCYAPSGPELYKCLHVLARRRKQLRLPGGGAEVGEALAVLVDYYGDDLYAIDQHLERMERLQCTLEEALTGQTEASAFAVVDALSQGKPALVELRMGQCLMSGVDAGMILGAVARFFVQLANIHGALKETPNLAAVFKSQFIPYPAQEKMRQGLKFFPVEKVARFLYLLPEYEMQMRTNRHPHEWLASELIGLLPGGFSCVK